MLASLSQSEIAEQQVGEENSRIAECIMLKGPSFHNKKKLSNLCNTTNHKYSSFQNQGKPVF